MSTLREWTTSRMLLLHLGVVAAVVAAVLLGRWQLGAWQGHREDRAAELAQLAPVPLADVFGSDDPFPPQDAGRPVTVRGTFLPEETVTVTDRLQHGDTGRWVVGSLAVCDDTGPCSGDGPVVPVVLGWTDATGDDAVRLGDADLPAGPVTLTARLQPAEQDDAVDPDPRDDELPSLTIVDFVDRLDQDLYSGFLILDEPARLRAGLEPVTADSLPKPPASTGLRNLLYAVQWWVFGAFAVVVWWRWVRDEREAAARARGGSAGGSPDGSPPRLPSAV